MKLEGEGRVVGRGWERGREERFACFEKGCRRLNENSSEGARNVSHEHNHQHVCPTRPAPVRPVCPVCLSLSVCLSACLFACLTVNGPVPPSRPVPSQPSLLSSSLFLQMSGSSML